MKKIYLLQIVLMLILIQTPVLASNPYQKFSEGRFDINMNGNYFKSESNFSEDGEKQNLASGYYLQNLDVTSSARYGFSSDWGFLAGFNVATAESADAISTRTNSNINRLDFGAEYLFYNSEDFKMFSSLTYSHAMEAVDLNTDSALNSDGVSEIKPEIYARFNFNGIYPYLAGGLNYRMEGLSTLVTYAAGAEARFEETGVGAALIGFVTVKDDEKTDQAVVRENVTNRVNGGSKKYFSINPNEMKLQAHVNFAFASDWILKFFAGHTVMGSNTANGYNAGFELNWSFGYSPEPSSHSRQSDQNKLSRDLSPEDFKEDIQDGVNQDYFKSVTPKSQNSSDGYIQQIEGQKQNLKNVTTPDTELEQELMTVQTKKINKKKAIDKDYKIKLKKKQKSQ